MKQKRERKISARSKSRISKKEERRVSRKFRKRRLVPKIMTNRNEE